MDQKERSIHYRKQVVDLTQEISRRQCYGRGWVVAQLITFAGLFLSLWAYTAGVGSWMGMSAFLCLMGYLLVRHYDGQNSEQLELLQALRRSYQQELNYLEGDYSCFGDGENYLDASHPFALDMDLFGPRSLFNRINRTVTVGGSDYLAQQLGETSLRSAEEIARRSASIRELAADEPLCMRFIAQKALRQQVDTHQVRKVLQQVQQVSIPTFAGSRVALGIAWSALTGFGLLVVLALLGRIPVSGAVCWGLLQLVLIQICCSPHIRRIDQVVGNVRQQMRAYVELMEIMTQATFHAPENRQIMEQLSEGEQSALASMRELKRIMDGIDRRGNAIYNMLFNTVALVDFFLIRRYLRWSCYSLSNLEGWIESVSRFDALVSMATFCRNEPDAVEAEWVETAGIVYRAEGLYHPFLGAKAVRNDFQIDDRHFYIVTGANMAGKSTFLRSIGINYILALNGLPVFADRLTVSRFSLFSSMRKTDDLTHGISYFNAELLRLQQLIRYCQDNPPTLIILDEILKGTNSMDKLNGSRMFLEAISRCNVAGVIATHDLELAKMVGVYPDRFHAYCFEIALSDRITYSYRISPGVARNQNATYLLQQILQAP